MEGEFVQLKTDAVHGVLVLQALDHGPGHALVAAQDPGTVLDELGYSFIPYTNKQQLCLKYQCELFNKYLNVRLIQIQGSHKFLNMSQENKTNEFLTYLITVLLNHILLKLAHGSVI